MTYVNAGTLGTLPGRRDELVAHLTRHSPHLAEAGCLTYEVGVNDAHPDTVFVVEIWTDADAHRASLLLPEVRESISAAQEWLTGDYGGWQFTIAGSPLAP